MASYKAPPSDLVFRFEPATHEQAEAQRLFNSKRILLMVGGAGTGKTHVAMGLALGEYLAGRGTEKIYLTRPLVPAGGEELGFLPGDLREKVGPFMTPFYQVQSRLLFGKLPGGVLEPIPLALLRGWTFSDCVAVLDEAQNSTYSQLKLYLSRMGKGSRLILCGDPDQSDLPGPGNDFQDVVNCLRGHPAVGVVRFSSDLCIRDPLVSSILARL